MLRRLGPPDGSFLAEIVDTFVANAPDHLAAVASALAAGDLVGVGQEAHYLKGQAATVGATAMACAAADVEATTATGDPGGLSTSLVVLTDEYHRAEAALRASVRAGAAAVD